VRIDGISNPEHLNCPNGRASASTSKSSDARGADAGDSAGRTSAQRSLIEAALAENDVNTQAVEEARNALLAGELDTPEAARRAAETILDSGV
jgi:anti-sigma28 factor (negative regulator of flagellin synthesis)